MVKNNPEEFFGAVEKAKEIVIISSLPVDNDSIGAGLAVKRWLFGLRKKADLYIPKKPTDPSPEFLKNFKVANTNKLDYSKYDLLIALDCSNPDMQLVDYRRYGKFQLPKIKTAAIDHHVSNSGYSKNIIFERTSSTCELIYRYMYRGKKVDKDTATALLYGITSDTGYFRWEIYPETLVVCQELINQGADFNSIVQKTFFNSPRWHFKNLPTLLSKVKFNQKLGLSYLTITKRDLAKMRLSEERFDSLKSYYQAVFARSVVGFPVDFVFTRFQKGVVHVSGRVDTFSPKALDLSVLSQRITGTRRGHPGASGFDVEGTIEEAKKKVFRVVAELQKEMKHG